MKVHGLTIDSVSQAVYLGDVINQDGSNTGHIRDRVSKGMGQMNTVMNLLKTVSFGSKFFEIAVTLREAHLVNGMLSTTEILYGLRKREIDEKYFECTHLKLYRKLVFGTRINSHQHYP